MKLQNQLADKYDKEMENFFEKWLKVEEIAQEKASGQRNPIKAINKMSE